MAITVPTTKTVISTTAFGIPVANWINSNTPTAWTTLPLSNGWVSSESLPQYRKIGDIVYVRGNAGNGAAGTIGTLPVGFRPPSSMRIGRVIFNGAFVVASLDFSTAGVIATGFGFPANTTICPLDFYFSTTA